MVNRISLIINFDLSLHKPRTIWSGYINLWRTVLLYSYRDNTALKIMSCNMRRAVGGTNFANIFVKMSDEINAAGVTIGKQKKST